MTVPKVPPFVRVSDALAWALDRINRASLPRGPYYAAAAEVLDQADRGRVFRVVAIECSKLDAAGEREREWHVCRRLGDQWQPTGHRYTDRVPFPQAKAAELASTAEDRLARDLEIFFTHAAVRALKALGRDPFRELVLHGGELPAPRSPAVIEPAFLPQALREAGL